MEKGLKNNFCCLCCTEDDDENDKKFESEGNNAVDEEGANHTNFKKPDNAPDDSNPTGATGVGRYNEEISPALDKEGEGKETMGEKSMETGKSTENRKPTETGKTTEPGKSQETKEKKGGEQVGTIEQIEAKEMRSDEEQKSQEQTAVMGGKSKNSKEITTLSEKENSKTTNSDSPKETNAYELKTEVDHNSQKGSDDCKLTEETVFGTRNADYSEKQNTKEYPGQTKLAFFKAHKTASELSHKKVELDQPKKRGIFSRIKKFTSSNKQNNEANADNLKSETKNSEMLSEPPRSSVQSGNSEQISSDKEGSDKSAPYYMFDESNMEDVELKTQSNDA